MNGNRWLDRLSQHERLNFLLTNRIPRRYATLAMGRLSRVENPLVRALSFALWRTFGGDLKLHEAERGDFKSVHDCFTRRLKAGARPIDADPRVIVSPCDAVVGAHGPIRGTEVFQAKGFPYALEELIGDGRLVAKYRDGVFATLRLKSNMYHRFHAPCDARVREVVYVSGDTWNVNPIALKRIERLYCKNERALIDLDLGRAAGLLLVPVAAILVASIRLHCLAVPLKLTYRGPNRLTCDVAYLKGDEMGWFEHGSTILVFGTKHFALGDGVRDGAVLEMGRPLMREL
jgi:phosphatidylserine decarboxylase